MMNNFIGLDTRNRRNLNTTFPPIHVPVSNYSTKAKTKENMNVTCNTMFLNNLHLIPDPLKKNLADSVITDKDINMTKTKEYMPKEAEKPPSSQTSEFYPKLRNIISGVINVMGAMFQWRDSSPASQYYDCFEGDYIENSEEPMSGSVPWQSANCDVQNKNSWAQSIFDDNNETNWNPEMMSSCSPALTDDQINQVCLLLKGESNYMQIPNSKSKPFESGSVEVFEDAFCPDQLSLSGDSYLEPYCYQEELFNSYASNLKSNLNTENIDSKESKDMTPKQNSDGDILSESVIKMSPKQDSVFLTNPPPEMSLIHDIVRNSETDKYQSPRISPQPINEIIEKPALVIETLSAAELSEETKPNMTREDSPKSDKSEIISTIKENVVSSCEDKLNRLKALLKSKCSKKIENSVNDDNTRTNNITENIVCDTVFGDEISIPSTACLRLAEPFDEVTGKFYSSSVESDDSFQIVFTDDVKASRCRIPSECESEDSFIVFEESPDSCYISDDVFGNVQINHYSGSDTSDSEDDSGCESRLCPGFSRTVEDLTDCKLYDEVDSSTVMAQHYNHCVTSALQDEQEEDKKTSKDVPRKKVHFSSDPPKVHVMRVWAYAARQARIGEWEQHARDRERFKSRINDVEMAISWVLKPQHRRLVMFQRFMPWWNAQKRNEQKEKKQRELEEQMKQQEELKIQSTQDKVELNNNNEETVNIQDNNTTEQQLQERLQEETQNNDTEEKVVNNEIEYEASVNNEIENKDVNSVKYIPNEAEENRNLDVKEKKAPDRANSQEAELDNNFQCGHEPQMKNPCDDVSDDSAPAAPSSESDR